MIPLNGPPRLTQNVAAPASLRRAIRLAARVEPTAQDLKQLKASLSPLRAAIISPERARVAIDSRAGRWRWPQRKMIIGARVAAAIMAACVSVTWASVRFWGSSAALRSWIVLGQTTERVAPTPANPAAPTGRASGKIGSRPVVDMPFAPAVVPLDLPIHAAPKHGRAPVSVRDVEPPSEPSAAIEAAAEPAETPAPKPPSEAGILLLARRALRLDPAQALRWIREHEKRFPNGSLSQEREVLAVEALRAVGRSAEADARLARFRERYPGSIHDRRIENRNINQAPQDDAVRATSEPSDVGAPHLPTP